MKENLEKSFGYLWLGLIFILLIVFVHEQVLYILQAHLYKKTDLRTGLIVNPCAE